MKILYFNYLYDIWGMSIGSTIKALELMKAVREYGHEIKFIWRREQENYNNGKYEIRKPHGLTKQFMAKFLHESHQILTNIKFCFEENKILDQESPDLLISRLEAYTLSSIYLANRKKIPVIIEADAPVAYEKMNYQDQFITHQKIIDYFEVNALKKSRLSFTISNQLKQYFVEKGVTAESVYVIPNGADPDRFRPDVPCDDVKQQYQLQNSLVIGFVGSFNYWHGIENLMQIILEMTRRYDQVKFLMVGDGGPFAKSLEKFIYENNLSQHVYLTGLVKHPEIPRYIATMDIVLAPYPKLEFGYYSPIKLYEYLSSGKAVVSSRMGQITEVIRDGENGLLCEPDNISEMCNKISELISHPELIKKIGDQARHDVLLNHTWRKRGEQLAALCEAVVNGTISS